MIKRRHAIVAAFLVAFAAIGLTNCSAATYYVGAGGSDSNAGTPTAPFLTTQHAADTAQAGDTVYFLTGTYKNPYPSGAVMEITHSGRPDAWIHFAAAPGQHPVFQSDGWSAISIHAGASYIEIHGLTLRGINPSLTLAEAQQHAKDGGYARMNTNGIMVDGRQDGLHKPHHISIIGNTVTDFPGGGIGTCQADYITVADNIVADNAWYNVYGCSGISLFQSWNYDDAPGYHNKIVRNQCFGNRNFIPTMGTGTFTDGNGIILDSCKNIGTDIAPYRGRTLIANNLCYENGGSGIHTFNSEHADIIYNTCIDNDQTPEIVDGQLFPNSSDDIRFENNIVVAPTTKPVNSNWNNADITWDYNILWGGAGKIKGPHDILADPKVAVTRKDFTLHIRVDPKSPAIDSADPSVPISEDLLHHSRPKGKGYDRGCIEVR